MSIDPVCGMEVSEGSKWKSEYNGIVYYFCSEHCFREFQKDPGKYVSTMKRESKIHKHH
ncbi:MAG: YHS domain-containing protein [Thermoprotei archaeon]